MFKLSFGGENQNSPELFSDNYFFTKKVFFRGFLFIISKKRGGRGELSSDSDFVNSGKKYRQNEN